MNDIQETNNHTILSGYIIVIEIAGLHSVGFWQLRIHFPRKEKQNKQTKKQLKRDTIGAGVRLSGKLQDYTTSLHKLNCKH